MKMIMFCMIMKMMTKNHKDNYNYRDDNNHNCVNDHEEDDDDDNDDFNDWDKMVMIILMNRR